jgi:30S ribosomal protein 3
MDNKSLQLKVEIAWFENFLGLAINLVGLKQQYFLTPYYFWPKTDAWEQLKLELDSKSWLTEEEKIHVLQTISNVMQYWLLHRKTKVAKDLKKEILILTN